MRRDDSSAIVSAPRTPRAALLADLAEHMKRAIETGDVEAARVAHEAIGRLLGSDSGTMGAVVDLAGERVKRGT